MTSDTSAPEARLERRCCADCAHREGRPRGGCAPALLPKVCTGSPAWGSHSMSSRLEAAGGAALQYALVFEQSTRHHLQNPPSESNGRPRSSGAEAEPSVRVVPKLMRPSRAAFGAGARRRQPRRRTAGRTTWGRRDGHQGEDDVPRRSRTRCRTACSVELTPTAAARAASQSRLGPAALFTAVRLLGRFARRRTPHGAVELPDP